MANNHFAATLYGEVATQDSYQGGVQLLGNGYGGAGISKSYPSVVAEFRAISPGVSITTQGTTLTINSIITIYPQGLSWQGKAKSYVCDQTLATLNTNAT